MRAWGKIAAVAGSAIAAAGCSLLPGGEPEATEPPDHSVVLEVAGGDVEEADLTYTGGDDGGEEQGAELPWRKTLTVTSLDDVSVTAQNAAGTGELTCTITVDGEVREQVSVEGEFALVACDLADAPARTPTAG